MRQMTPVRPARAIRDIMTVAQNAWRAQTVRNARQIQILRVLPDTGKTEINATFVLTTPPVPWAVRKSAVILDFG